MISATGSLQRRVRENIYVKYHHRRCESGTAPHSKRGTHPWQGFMPEGFADAKRVLVVLFSPRVCWGGGALPVFLSALIQSTVQDKAKTIAIATPLTYTLERANVCDKCVPN